MTNGSRVLPLIAVLVVVPIAAVVVITALLLFGVPPHSVFLPGFFVRARLVALGFHAPNAVGVVTTVVVWWAIILVLWIVIRLVVRRKA